MAIRHPLILWAQRSSHVYISVEIEDMAIDELKIESDMFIIR